MTNYHDHGCYVSSGWIFTNHAPIPISSTMNCCCSLCPICMYHMKPSHVVETFVQCMHSSPHLTKATGWHNHANTKSNPKVRTFPWPPHLCPTMWACNKHMRQNFCWPTEMFKNKHAENKHETQHRALIPSIASKQPSPLLDVGRQRWENFFVPPSTFNISSEFSRHVSVKNTKSKSSSFNSNTRSSNRASLRMLCTFFVIDAMK